MGDDVSAPDKGIEVDLKELGCPYPALDSRTLIWMEGFRQGHKTGLQTGGQLAMQAMQDVIEESRA